MGWAEGKAAGGKVREVTEPGHVGLATIVRTLALTGREAAAGGLSSGGSHSDLGLHGVPLAAVGRM